ncbi:MAG TPA: lamin tail domain-containing protein [Blastocatellia bacterium]|nr:lamin tail domain-containing protein [Blastocatellia bacterium]
MKRKTSLSSARRSIIALLLIATFITASYWATSPPTVQALSSGVVISQVYGGGGNVGATFTHDFIELFNRGTTPVSLNGWSVQYTSATGTGNFGANTTLITPLPNVTLAPGQYFLIQEASQAAVGSPLPTPDVVDASPIAMAAGAGKVALVNTTTPLGCNGGSTPCSPAALATIVDLVGYGNANFFEGAAAPTLSNTTAAIRKMNGCTETDNNANDFMAATPTPRNTATALAPCNMDTAPAVSVTTPASGAANVGVAANIEITFSEAVNVTGTWFDIQGSVSGMHLATSSGGPTTFTLDPTVDFANNETVTVTVFAAQVSDQDANDPPDTMALNFTLSFTTIPPPPPTRPIHEIQGDGAASPFVNQLVLTNGIVTARKSNGFFLQDPSVDADPDTSEGIFVFTSSLPAVAKGDAVTVTGQVTEFFNLTQVGRGGNPATFSVGSSGNVVPAAITFTTTILNPAGPLDQLERFEGMLMHADALVSVAPTNEFGEIFTVLDGVARPFREPGIEITLPVPPDPTSGVPDCCIPRWDLNPERIMVDSDGLVGSSSISVTSNVTFSNVTGPLDFTFSNYKVLPEAPPMTSANMSAIPVPAPAACEFTVAGYNIENFGNNATQRQKAALAIRTVMRYPDIIGHIEILNLASLQALAAQVNSDAVAAGDPDPVYQAFLIPAPAGGTQNVGFLVKTSRVQVNSVTQERATDTFINPNNGMPETLHDRPPLVLRATVDPMGAAPLPVIVMVNHTRSFIDIELVAGDGPRVRAKRKAQGESVAGLVQELQTNNPTTPLILVGDYNAYQFNDGYTDPISVIKGAPTPDDQIVVDESPDLVNPNLVNLTDMLPADQRYSFVFEGTPQALDHVLINTAAQSFFKGYAVARSNSDFPESLASDPSRPEKNSDHDMPVAYFRLPLAITNVSVDRSVLWPPNHKMVDVTVNYTTANNCGPVTCTLSVTSNEPVNGDDDGNTAPDWEVIDAHHVRLRAERSGSGTGRIYTITITCTDSMGGTATATATVSVPLNL